MKIAYIFHGHSRTWKQCHESFFNNVFNHAPGDIFIHTWDTVNASQGSWWNGWGDLNGEQLNISNQLTDIEGIKKTYNPKIFICEKHPKLDLNTNQSLLPPNHPKLKAFLGIKCMLQSRRKIYEETIKSEKYDKIFSLRLDIKFLNSIDKKEFYEDNLYSPHNSLAIDLWNLGSPEVIDIITSYYQEIDNYWYRDQSIYGEFYEDRFASYLGLNGIKIDNPVYARSNVVSHIKFKMVESSLICETVRPF